MHGSRDIEHPTDKAIFENDNGSDLPYQGEEGECDCIRPHIFITAGQFQPRMALLCFIHQSLHYHLRGGLGVLEVINSY